MIVLLALLTTVRPELKLALVVTPTEVYSPRRLRYDGAGHLLVVEPDKGFRKIVTDARGGRRK
jgi:hypothetical protein